MAAKNPIRLFVAEKDSPRLWLAPSKFTKSLTKSAPKKENPFLYVNVREGK